MTTRRTFLKQSLLVAGATALAGPTATAQTATEPQPKYRLPYKNTYVKETFVTENEFRIAKPETITPGTFEEARAILPLPTWEANPRAVEMYWKAWQIAIGNIKAPEPGSGFVSSYLDVAYNGNIFMWDSAFMMMFARYGTRFFPFQRTLDNFYAKQHPDGFICREIKADGADCFERYDPTSTGPNLLPWAEIVYYHQFGDLDRVHRIFPALCAYYKWLRLNHTWRNGTYWTSGWGTGMDNMPRVQSKYNTIYSHGHMIWLDVCLQQYFTAGQLLEMGFHTERWQEIEDFEDEQKMLKRYINEHLWDDQKGFLFDQYADDTLSDTIGVYAYWVLLTDILSRDRLDALVAHLENPEEFNRLHRVPSLAANHPKYKENGRYWQGGVWPGANYMVITGLLQQGYRKLAYEIARNHYDNVLKVFEDTGTFWEYYSPESATPGFMARKDFVGWGGLAPIAGLIEHVFGLRSNVAEGTLTLDVNLTDAYALERYPYGLEGLVSVKVGARRTADEEPKVEITTNVPLNLTVLWGEKEKTRALTPGSHHI